MRPQKNTHVYYDISLHNDTKFNKIAQLTDNRSTPLLKNPNDYQLSVVRFTIPTSYVPIFIWPDAGGNTPDNNYFSVTINNSQVFLIYVPENLPASSINPQYLFVYSYQQFIDAINVALNTAFIAAGGPATTPPYMVYNSVSGLCSLIAEYAYENQTNYKIYFNSSLFAFFENFEAIRNGQSLALGKDIQLLVKNNGDNDYIQHPPGYGLGVAVDSYKMEQEYNSLFLWNSVRSLVFMSNNIPVADEALNVKNSSSITTGNVYRKILTDFECNIQSGLSNNTLRSYIQYTPMGEYRMIDLQSNSPLYTFDIQIYFQTKDLSLYDLYISGGESISMKVMFRDKTW